MNRITITELIEALSKRFPKAWFKDGIGFNEEHKNSVWTGEGSQLNDGKEMFSYYSSLKPYSGGGIHIQLRKFVEKRGYYVGCYDPGTFFIYPN